MQKQQKIAKNYIKEKQNYHKVTNMISTTAWTPLSEISKSTSNKEDVFCLCIYLFLKWRDTLRKKSSRGSQAEEERKSVVGQSYGMTEEMEGGGGGGTALGHKGESDGQMKKKEECSEVMRDHKKDTVGGGFGVDRALHF